MDSIKNFRADEYTAVFGASSTFLPINKLVSGWMVE
jgi:hypothetical protein